MMTTRVQIIRLRTSGNAICILINRDGTWRTPPFMLYAAPRAGAGMLYAADQLKRGT